MTILITGANRGIGAGLAAAYSRRGCDVVAASRCGTHGAQLDVTDLASLDALSRRLEGASLQLLICNAGVYLDRGEALVDGYAPELWADTFSVNVTGVFLTVQAFLPHLMRANAPKIAIISSQMGSSARASGTSLIYRASKAAATNLAFNLASYLKTQGIAVGAYHPGWVRTDMGGGTANITIEESVAGLMDRFEALTLETTGAFETWDGRPHPV